MPHLFFNDEGEETTTMGVDYPTEAEILAEGGRVAEPTHYLVRVGDGAHLISARPYGVWGVNSRHTNSVTGFLRRVVPGDVLWFVQGGSGGKVLLVAEYQRHCPREDATNEALGWGPGEWDTEIHYAKDVTPNGVYTRINSPLVIRRYNPAKCAANLPELYSHLAEEPVTSVVFVTFKNGPYPDHWRGEAVNGRREMHWCGQTGGKRDGLVRPGTLVAVRPNKAAMAFTLVGRVVEKELLREGRPSTYRLSVELTVARTIARDTTRDRCVHWTVLRELGLAHDGGYFPQGIYG